MGAIGYIYILTNEHMPHLVKIGRTLRDPEARALEISSATGVPTPYRVFWAALVDDHERVELFLHRKLVKYRVGKEFFQLQAEEAQSSVTSLLADNSVKIYEEKSIAAAQAARDQEEYERKIHIEAARQEAIKRRENEQIEEQKRKNSQRLIELRKSINALEFHLEHPSFYDEWPKYSGLLMGFLFLILGAQYHHTSAFVIGVICIPTSLWLISSDNKDKEDRRKQLLDLKKRYDDLKAGRTEVS